MDLESLRIFVKVAELASFSKAADQLGLRKARVSNTLKELEAQLGARLLTRTTRAVRFTSDGEAFYERCRLVLEEVEGLQAMFERSPQTLRGRLRADLPTGLALNFVFPRLPEFMAAHPLLAIELSTTDRRVDIVNEGFDCVVRVGALHDSSVVARVLGRFAMANCASPAYLEKHGRPTSLDDLDRHQLIGFGSAPGNAPQSWEYRAAEGYRMKPMASPLTVNNAQAYQAACLAGLGFIQAPRAGLQHLIDRGQLAEVLPQFAAQPMQVSMLYPHRRHLSPRLRAFMDWMALVMAPHLE